MLQVWTHVDERAFRRPLFLSAQFPLSITLQKRQGRRIERCVSGKLLPRREAGGDLSYRQQAGQYIPGRVVVWDTTSGTDVEARLRAMPDA